MASTALDGDADSPVGPASQTINDANNDLEQLAMRADPDASATVTDFLDFTEHLPSDITRSLTLIAQLDESYLNASASVNELTTIWSKLPALPPNERVDSVKLRSDISEQLNYAMSARTFAHAEACRMQEIVGRHHNRIQIILQKLRTMHENFPTIEEQALKSPVQQKSPHMARGPKVNVRVDGSAEKARPQRIIVPGEVLGPHEIDFNIYSDSSESSCDESVQSPSRPRIKLVKPGRRSNARDNGPPPVSTSTALAKLKPPPENAIPGSADAPWLQLTQYELAKLRKRMKKNSQWIPSDTMIARELRNLGRGVEAFKAAEKKAEDEGRPFEPTLPSSVVDSDSGVPHPPEGAISAETLTADEMQISDRGVKLNEAKKIKRETLARMAAEEAEESARKMAEAARMFMNHEASPTASGSSHDKSQQEAGQNQGKGSNKSKVKKRKRDSLSETPVPEKPQGSENLPTSQVPGPTPTQSEKPQAKRTKTETPIPPPQITPRPPSAPPQHPAIVPAPSLLVETPVPVPHLGRQCLTKTPVPVPLPITIPSDSSTVAVRTTASSGQTSPVPPTVTTTVPTKPPAESTIPPPIKTSTTPILPPVRDLPKRETRQSAQPAAANVKQPNSSRGSTPAPAPPPAPPPVPAPAPAPAPASVSAPAPALAPVPVLEPQAQSGSARRPASRGKAASQEPPPTFLTERARRTSTARNTPAPEVRQASKRAKRPAPGVVTTNSGGTSAIGKRKAAPRKKARGGVKKDKGNNLPPEAEAEIEVDDDGNVIDPEEPRYCLCNRVSFGTMIQCDNVDNCEKEWFHLECVGLTEIPARTTKWYCPQCRILLNIGERGEVTSRGVKM